ncbi:hypothetical protein P2318_24455 [Myxococcaceae bacterium GXIMD 01537]
MDVHYTWVGPYREDAMRGPTAMKRALGSSATVYFWCLEAQEAAFKARATTDKNGLTVRSIEGFLRTTLGADPGRSGRAYDAMFRWWYWYGQTEDEVARGVQCLLNTALRNHAVRTVPEKTRVREAVNIKNLWNYFLLYTWGGYVMDTNVEALVSNGLRLEAPGRLKCPRIVPNQGYFVSLYECGQPPHEGKTFATNVNRDIGNINLAPKVANGLNKGDYMEGRTHIVDVWMLSAERYHADVLRALKHFIFLMHAVYAKFQASVFGAAAPTEGDVYAYHMACADAVVEALLTGMVIEANGRPAMTVNWAQRTWEARSAENHKTILALNVRKTLNRSHVA